MVIIKQKLNEKVIGTGIDTQYKIDDILDELYPNVLRNIVKVDKTADEAVAHTMAAMIGGLINWLVPKRGRSQIQLVKYTNSSYQYDVKLDNRVSAILNVLERAKANVENFVK